VDYYSRSMLRTAALAAPLRRAPPYTSTSNLLLQRLRFVSHGWSNWNSHLIFYDSAFYAGLH
jgi:hypothetical protein